MIDSDTAPNAQFGANKAAQLAAKLEVQEPEEMGAAAAKLPDSVPVLIRAVQRITSAASVTS